MVGGLGVLLYPSLMLTDGDEPLAPFADHAELGGDVVIEEVNADTNRARRLYRRE